VPPMTAASPPRAVILNLTATDGTAPSFLTAWPDGQPRPATSDLNLRVGQTVPNLVVVELGSSGKVDLFNAAGSVNLVADVLGWYS